jgi:hypothetical protein
MRLSMRPGRGRFAPALLGCAWCTFVGSARGAQLWDAGADYIEAGLTVALETVALTNATLLFPGTPGTQYPTTGHLYTVDGAARSPSANGIFASASLEDMGPAVYASLDAALYIYRWRRKFWVIGGVPAGAHAGWEEAQQLDATDSSDGLEDGLPPRALFLVPAWVSLGAPGENLHDPLYGGAIIEEILEDPPY